MTVQNVRQTGIQGRQYIQSLSTSPNQGFRDLCNCEEDIR